jgi:signal transduction histidine kinase
MSPHAQTLQAKASRWRLTVVLGLICLLLLAGVWLVAWMADRRERENHIDELAARVRTAANGYAASVGAHLRMADQLLTFAAADYERDAGRFDVQFWLSRLPPDLAPRIVVADAAGLVRQSSLGVATLGTSIAHREHFAAHRRADSGRLHVGNVEIDADGAQSLPISRRINDRAGRFAGVIVFSVDPAVFLDVLDRLKVGVAGRGTVMREGGFPIVRVAGFRRITEFADPDISPERYESADAAIMGQLYEAEVVRASRGIDDYDVIVDAEGNVAEALAEIAARRELIWLAAGALTLAIVGLFLAMAIDLARLRRMRALLERRNRQLSEANRMAEDAVAAKSRFLANMSHELRTPLNAIIGFADLLKSGLYGHLNPRQADYAQHIHASGNHLLELINDVLDISRLDLEAYALDPERLDLGETIAAGLRTLSVAAEDKGVSLSADLPRAVPQIVADERALKQVLLNLLSNAVKFTPKGGAVRVAAGLREDGALALTVSDTGIGIAPEDLPRLFRPFQQAENARRQNPQGTGLGLVISRRLMEKHGGTLDLESELGKGTRAIAVFPKERVVPVALAKSAPKSALAA